MCFPPNRVSKATVGALNCEAALEVLAQEGFTVAASDLGGTRGRRIHFHTGTGEVLVYRLDALDSASLKGNSGTTA